MSYLYVKNLKGTSKYQPKIDDSWLKGWERIKNKEAILCQSCFCSKYDEDLVGAHVQKITEDDSKWYIIPFCKKCNNKNSDKLLVNEDELVSVNEIND